jgi:MoaA/NifB/PqqE/SkfB family radical SAM enzyme
LRPRADDLLRELSNLRRERFSSRPEFLTALERVKSRYQKAAPPTADYLLYLMKSVNLVHLEWEYSQRFSLLSARPTNYLLDGSNNCQLGCGSCQHTFDRSYASANFLPIASGSMSRKVHNSVLKLVSPWAYAADYYNQSETFLNKLAPEFIKEAGKRRVVTRVSSNFSIPRLDTDALVHSGLNFLDLSIDGATQETYEQYRRGGSLELIFENVRKLLSKRGSNPVPYVRWKFLAFEHNVHEMERAAKLARSLGVDEIAFSAGMPGPGGQTADGFDPNLHATKESSVFSDRDGLAFVNSNDDLTEEMAELASTSLLDQFEQASSGKDDPDEQVEGAGWCDWLYYCPAFDANGLVRACAIPDYSHRGSLNYGNLVTDGAQYFNSDRFRDARRQTIHLKPLRPILEKGQATDDIACRRCPDRPSPCSQLPVAAGWHMSVGKKIVPSGILSEEVVALTSWSRHSVSSETATGAACQL